MKIFIGFDSREPAAYWIQRESIIRYIQNLEYEIIPLVRQMIQLQGDFWREDEGATEFTYTRFLVPYLCNYEGIAVFMDGDMMVRNDMSELEQYVNNAPVACVHHEHNPPEGYKFTVGGKTKQENYPKKNWSSLMVFNCEHLDCHTLTVDFVNQVSPATLHQFQWASEIVKLPLEWNWLDGWNTRDQCNDPKIVHFTHGIPGFHKNFTDRRFASEYLDIMMSTLYN